MNHLPMLHIDVDMNDDDEDVSSVSSVEPDTASSQLSSDAEAEAEQIANGELPLVAAEALGLPIDGPPHAEAAVADVAAPPADAAAPPVDAAVPPVDAAVPPIDAAAQPGDAIAPPPVEQPAVEAAANPRPRNYRCPLCLHMFAGKPSIRTHVSMHLGRHRVYSDQQMAALLRTVRIVKMHGDGVNITSFHLVTPRR